MRNEPTPRPWQRDGRAVFHKERGTVCQCSTANSPAEAEANAEFIVRAVNAHDKLTAACKLAKERLDSLGCDWLGKGPDPLEEAIALAEGGEA